VKHVIQDIVKLRNEGLSFREIAREMNTTVGKIHYRWSKHLKEIESNEDNLEIPLKPLDVPQRLQLPTSYDLDCLCAMVRNPKTVYLYWELSNTRKSFLEKNFGTDWSSIPKYLKIYHVTSIIFNGHNALREFEVPLPEMTNNWFITELEPNQTYVVELGIKTENGSFFTILRSNPIDTPRNNINQVGLFSESVHNWKTRSDSKPGWLENFSTYSYYEKIK
jgi:hypothetical protein